MAALGSLSKLINKRGRRVIQIIKRMPLAIIINPSHQYFSIISMSVMIEAFAVFYIGFFARQAT
jgi:hypothetical protein